MRGPNRTISPDEYSQKVGEVLGYSDWVRIEQPMVDAFARITLDENPLHIDPAWAANTAFGGTIAHGFLTLSLMAAMAYQVCPALSGTGTSVNYGFDRLRFVSAVPVGSRVRGRFKLLAFDIEPSGRWRARYEANIEVEGSDVPAISSIWLTAGLAAGG